jgi:thiamine monophosphate synthase
MRARPPVPPLYAIADAQVLSTARLPAAVAEMAEEGVTWIQLRAKLLSGAELWRLAERCALRLAGSDAVLWIDDRADLVAALGPGPAGERLGEWGVEAARPGSGGSEDRGGPGGRLPWGLHLGQADLPPAAARPLVGSGAWIGLSTHDPAQLARAAADPEVDVVALGPIFPTANKERPDPPVGLEGLAQARAAIGKPLVAIGGIDRGNIAQVLAAGADAAAVLGAVCRGDVRRNCRELLAAAAAAPVSRRGRGRACASS